ncbi:unnamed protein product [Lasius platythorax]|uniref:Uncharacterized protein n=1 Tax=Lasius platythorax TaxID=488582 RepID=A0AAV2MWC1_9HYME
MDSSYEEEASEANDLVTVSGGASAAYVANGLGSASGARVPRASSDGRWNPISIRVPQPFYIQGSIDAVIDCSKCSGKKQIICCIGAKQLNEHVLKEHPACKLIGYVTDVTESFRKSTRGVATTLNIRVSL